MIGAFVDKHIPWQKYYLYVTLLAHSLRVLR